MSEAIALNVMQPVMARDDVCRIVNSITFLFDCVYLNAGFELDLQMPPEDREFVTRRLAELIELGAIRLWNVETFEADRPRFLGNHDCSIIDESEYLELYETAHLRLLEMRLNMFGETSQNFDGVTEIINGKQACFHLALASKFGASGIVHDRSTIQNYGSFLKSGLPSTKVIDSLPAEVASIAKLPDLASLPIESIERARKHLYPFRTKFLDLAKSKDTIELSTVEFDRLAMDAVTKIVSEYQSIKHQSPAERKYWANRIWRFVFGAKAPETSYDASSPFRLLLELEGPHGSKQK